MIDIAILLQSGKNNQKVCDTLRVGKCVFMSELFCFYFFLGLFFYCYVCAQIFVFVLIFLAFLSSNCFSRTLPGQIKNWSCMLRIRNTARGLN